MCYWDIAECPVGHDSSRHMSANGCYVDDFYSDCSVMMGRFHLSQWLTFQVVRSVSGRWSIPTLSVKQWPGKSTSLQNLCVSKQLSGSFFKIVISISN